MLEIYKGKKVLITGVTGFKGVWLALWLKKLGAEVAGISLPPNTPNHFALLDMPSKIDSRFIDLKEYDHCLTVIKGFQPEIIFHLAASAIVAKTFDEPRETFINNIGSSTNILEMGRKCKSIKAIVMITTDKVYQNNEWNWGYRENDELEGDDPYSASKVCIEHVINCYRKHFFPNIATARAGNVIGGGDWADFRLIPDIIRATLENRPVIIKTPDATRPWQHVLEPLYGYLKLGELLLLEPCYYNKAWNFGPTTGEMTVLEILKTAQKVWPYIKYEVIPQETHPSMVRLLKIDSTEAKKYLGWKTMWNMERTVTETIGWYKEFYEHKNIISEQQLSNYITERWASGGER